MFRGDSRPAQVPASLAAILGPGLLAAGWFGRKFFDRRWARLDRGIVRAETNLEDQRRLLLDLNGDIYQKWIWLADHRDAQDRGKSEPVANEISTWLYASVHYRRCGTTCDHINGRLKTSLRWSRGLGATPQLSVSSKEPIRRNPSAI